MSDKFRYTLLDLRRQLLQSKLQSEEFKAQIASLQKERAIHRKAGVPYETSPDTLAKAVTEYRAGGTSIRKLCAKHNLQRGRLHLAIKKAIANEPTFDNPGKHAYRTTKQIVAGHKDFLARLAEED